MVQHDAGSQEYNFGSMNNNNNNNNTIHYRSDTTAAFDAQVQELSEPSPESFSLAATLQLLDPFETSTRTTSNSNHNDDDDTDDEDDDDNEVGIRRYTGNNNDMVYLMTPSYLQNWLYWAFHQNVKKGESNRLVEALKLAAKRYGLTPPQDATAQQLEDYVDPGPIDATFLSLNNNSASNTDDDYDYDDDHDNDNDNEGGGNESSSSNNNNNNLYGTNSSSSHDLLLSPNVIVKEGEFDHGHHQHHNNNIDSEFPELLRRVKSLPMVSDNNNNKNNNNNGTAIVTDDNNNDDNNGTAAMTLHLCDSIDVEGDKIACCAVPYRFYETLRMSQGVMCDDGFAVSYQPYPNETKSLIHHHLFQNNNSNSNSNSNNNNNNNNNNSAPIKDTVPGGVNTTNGNHHQNDNNQNGNTNDQSSSYLSAVNGVVSSSYQHDKADRTRAPRRPIEFPRRIIMKSVDGGKNKYGSDLMNDAASPMTKLLQEQERLAPPRMIPSVELYPIKLNYQIVDGCENGSTTTSSKHTKCSGFVLVSRRTKVYDVLQDLLKVTAPEISSSCKRVWSLQQGRHSDGTSSSSIGSKPTKLGDGYEVVDLATLDGKLKSIIKNTENNGTTTTNNNNSKTTPTIPKLLVGEWTRTHQPYINNGSSNNNINYDDDNNELVRELDLLIEIKRPNTSWPRDNLELENRVQVGDFVDAQDITGKWYESIVQDISDTTVKVHYLGWASRWNATLLKCRSDSDNTATDEQKQSIQSPKLQPIAPLYTHCRRWREGLGKGAILEVRDSQSKVDRPKWYKAVVKKIGGRHISSQKPIEGGAPLELLHDIIGSSSTDNNIEKNDENNDNDNNENRGPKNGQHNHQSLSAAQSLILLNRRQQILVEVEEERDNTTPADISMRDIEIDESNSFLSEVDPLKPQPPFLRWVNLYGEEICAAGTHMKIIEAGGDLAVVTLRYEYEAGRKPVEIMKSWNGMYGQGMVKEAMRGTPPAPGAVGMHNLGNSCFLNSIIQCLNHIAPLTQYFLEGKFSEEINRQNPLGSGGHVAIAYAALLKEVWSGNYSALAPRLLKQTVASFAPQFRNSYQHDSQEFCQFLMDGIHEDCNRVTKKPYVEELEGFGMKDEKAAIETWRKHLLRHDSIIVDRCQGMHRSHLTCPSCGRESIKFDVFSTVSLPVVLEEKEGSTNKTVMRVEDCIEKFLEGEQLDEMNAWYCQGCKKHVCALKMIALWSVPDILILHLKRFQFENCSVSNNILRSKIDDKVTFPLDNLDLRKYVLGPTDVDAPPIYNLFGVSEHVGVTANSGHYTATVRNCKDGRWYRYNDAHVGETTGETSITGNAYLLFYQRAKGNAKWGGMEKAMTDKQVDPYDGVELDQDGFQEVKTKKKK